MNDDNSKIGFQYWGPSNSDEAHLEVAGKTERRKANENTLPDFDTRSESGKIKTLMDGSDR